MTHAHWAHQDWDENVGLETYRHKRDLNKTPEPPGRIRKSRSRQMFVVQKHASRHLHYDFRLEAEGVLKSWAIPKGPSTDPAEKRLAVQVEDHPLEYGSFEGEIEENQYGAGTVKIWDKGTYTLRGNWKEGFKKGKLNVSLKGKKLKGSWTLVRFKGGKRPDDGNWLLIKSLDKEAKGSSRSDMVAAKPDGVKTERKKPRLRAKDS